MIVNNLKFLRKEKGLTQAELLDFIGITGNTKWSDYERGKSTPPIDILLKISEKFNVSLDDLIKIDLSNGKDLENIQSLKISINSKENSKVIGKDLAKNTRFEDIESEASYRHNVYDLDSKAAAGVAVLLNDKDKLQQVPSLYMPHLGAGLHIRTKIVGDSMHNTIKDGDYTIATHCPEPAQALREGNIYIIIDKEDGLVCKRVYKVDKTHWEFVSDNDIYSPYKRHLNDVLALFRVVEVHTTDLRNYNSDTRKEISKLWKEMEIIKKKVNL